MNIQGNSSSSSSNRSQSHHNQQVDRNRQSLQPNMDKMSMEAYKKRQGQGHPGSNNQSQNPNMQNTQLTRATATSVSDPMHQSRKRPDQQHQSNAKKAHLSSSAQNSQLLQGKCFNSHILFSFSCFNVSL